MDKNCIFFKIIRGEIPTDLIYQDQNLVVFKDINPKASVHLLVVPREHIKNLMEVQESQKTLIAEMMMVMPKIAKQQGLDHGFRTVINTGSGGGQEIDHIHFHLLGNGLKTF